MTLGSLLAQLRIDLGDPNDGQWTANQKRDYCNRGVARTLTETRSYMSTQSITIVAGTADHDCNPVFVPLAVRLGDEKLDIKRMGSMAVLAENWDALPRGIPTRCIPLGGTYVKVAPTPDDNAAGIIGTVSSSPAAGGSGYAVGDVLDIIGADGSGGQVKVLTIAGSAVNTLELNSSDDSQSQTKYVRGTGYSTSNGAATTASTGSGTGCTVAIDALAKLEVYGPSSVTDMTADDDEVTTISEGRVDAILYAAREEAWNARPTMPTAKEKAAEAHILWLEECRKIEEELGSR